MTDVQFPGEVVIGHYCVVEGSVILTDENGKPVSGVAKLLWAPEKMRGFALA